MSDDSVGLYRYLCDLGDVVELSLRADVAAYRDQISQLSSSFRQYNPRKPDNRRLGLSLTSADGASHNDADLDSLVEYNKEHGTSYDELSFRVPTKEFEALTSLHQIKETFGDLGRSHVIRFMAGGFFPPHRDGRPTNLTCFRILVPLINSMPNDMVFAVDGQIARISPGRAYFINTIKMHYVFSFSDRCDMAVFNVKLTRSNVDAVMKNLLAR